MDIIGEKLVTDSEVKKFLEERKKLGELKYEQKNSLEVLGKFAALSSEKAEGLAEELRKVEKLRERHVIAIVNNLPEDEDDIRTILQKEGSILTKEEIDSILQTVKKMR